jgi:DNA-directed RNA polymerase-3 subunit RPC5
MRPQFHHIDAESEQARAAASRAMGVPQRAPAEARAVHMTVKSNVDGEEDSTDTMGARITAVQTELWKTHKFIDEDATEAWDSFQENMFVASELRIEDNGELQDKMPKLKTALDNPEYMDTISAPSNPAKLSRSKIRKSKDEKGKGKEKEGEAAEESDTSSTLSGQPSESKSKEETAA